MPEAAALDAFALKVGKPGCHWSHERVQDTHQGFFGDCGRAEGHQVLPFQAKEHGQRLDQDPEPAEVATLRIASETVGQHKEHDGAYRDDAQSPQKDVQGTLQGLYRVFLKAGL